MLIEKYTDESKPLWTHLIWVVTIGCAALFFSMSSCAHWKDSTQKTLAMLDTTTRGFSDAVERYYRDKCQSIAYGCQAKGDKVCSDLGACQELRHNLNMQIITVHTGIYSTMGLLTISDEDTVKKNVEKVVVVFNKLYENLKLAGVL